MHLLFFFPTSHFSIFLISHLIHHIHSNNLSHFKIYIILQSQPSLPIHELWNQSIQTYHLEYLYPPSIPFLTFLELKHLQNPLILSFLQNEIQQIFFHLPNFSFQDSSLSIKSYSHLLFSLQKPILLFCDIDSIHPSFPFHKSLQKHFFHKINKQSPHQIFYLPLSLGEDERGIISQHTLSSSLFSSFQQKQSLPPLLSLSSFSSIFPIFLLLIQQKYNYPSHFQHFLFLNTSLPSLKSTQSHSTPKWILSHIEKYHETLA